MGGWGWVEKCEEDRGRRREKEGGKKKEIEEIW